MSGNGYVTKNEFYLAASMAAAQLHGIPRIAKGISLEAMNASALTARLGAKAASFRPLTQFMSEVASKTASLIAKIEVIAIDLSRSAIDDLILDIARLRLQTARNSDPDCQNVDSLTPVEKTLEIRQHEIRSSIHDYQHRLRNLLSEILDNMQAARLASKSTRFEAAQLPTHRELLESIARSMEDIVTQIEALCNSSEDLLNESYEQYKRMTETNER